MASLEKRNGSFRVVFRFAGRKFSRSLQTTHSTEARASIARLEDNLRRIELGLLSPPAGVDISSFLLSDGRILGAPSLSAIWTLDDLCNCYSSGIPLGSLEESTIYGMQIHIKHLKRILGSRIPLETLTTATLQSYIAARSSQNSPSKRPISPATVKKELVTLRTMWNWALTMGHLDRPFPGRGLRFAKLEAKLPFRTLSEIEARLKRGGLTKDCEAKLWESAFLSLPEIETLLEHIRKSALEPYLFPMVYFAAHTGARRSEMIRSEIDDIDFHNRVVLIRERKRVRGMKSTRMVPLSAALSEVLRDWFERHPGGNFTFCRGTMSGQGSKTFCGASPLSPDGAHKQFKRALSGSRFAKLRGWHVLRHSFCSNCGARGIDQRVINAWVGHQSEEMVRRYRHLLPTQSRESIELVFGASCQSAVALVASEK